MGSSQRPILSFACLGLISVLVSPVPRSEGGIFSCFLKCDECANCSSTESLCDACRCDQARCKKRERKRKWCGEDAPVAPVGQSLGALNVNQVAIPVAPTQLAVPVSHTQMVTSPVSVAPQPAVPHADSAQLAELRDMLIRANESLQKAKAAQQTESQQAATPDDAAKVEELKAELDELKQQIQLLSKALGRLKK